MVVDSLPVGLYVIDRHYRVVVDDIKDRIRRDPDRLDNWLRLINTARNLERIADHATNIAEDVVFMVLGKDIRHGAGQQHAPTAQP